MLKLFIADLKMITRNKQALVWSLVFPVIFILIFGLFFGSNNGVTGSIRIINQSDSELAINIVQAIKDSDIFPVKDEISLDKAREEIEKSQLSAVVVIPDTFAKAGPKATNQVLVYYDPANAQTSSILANLIDKILTEASFKIQGTKQMFEVDQHIIGAGQKFNYFDFVLVGILGMALMNSSILGIAIGISKYREDKILKRLISTPIKPWKFIVAEVFSRLILNILQIIIILSIGILGFKGNISGNIFVVILVAILGGILFQLIGFTIATFAKNADATQGLAQIVTIPMMFLAGTFFPIDSLPKWLANVVQYLPLAPLLRMLRNVAIDNISPFTDPINIIVILGWIVLALFISIFKFRMTEE